LKELSQAPPGWAAEARRTIRYHGGIMPVYNKTEFRILVRDDHFLLLRPSAESAFRVLEPQMFVGFADDSGTEGFPTTSEHRVLVFDVVRGYDKIVLKCVCVMRSTSGAPATMGRRSPGPSARSAGQNKRNA
jgi:hypothetical protein